MEGVPLNERTVNALLAFKDSSDMQKILSEVLSFTLLPDQIVDLRAEFEKIDTNGDGEISLQALKEVLMQNAEAGSLGALTEKEIEDVFDAIRIRKSEPTIRWHEFLAAGLSQAKIDDRNLRLAFDRLDSDRKG
jgi:calcium-dependent protein kinase